jgi:hypothetical protein
MKKAKQSARILAARFRKSIRPQNESGGADEMQE